MQTSSFHKDFCYPNIKYFNQKDVVKGEKSNSRESSIYMEIESGYEYDMTGINKRLSDLIKSRRAELGMTQKQLAQGTGIDLKYIQRIESPKVIIEPRLSTLGKICFKLDLSLKDMMIVILDE